MRQSQPYLSRLYNRWKDFVVEDVPEDLAICEFDCRTLHCTRGEWASCDRRISKGRGELSPAHEEPRKEPEPPRPSQPPDQGMCAGGSVMSGIQSAVGVGVTGDGNT